MNWKFGKKVFKQKKKKEIDEFKIYGFKIVGLLGHTRLDIVCRETL